MEDPVSSCKVKIDTYEPSGAPEAERDDIMDMRV
jgi:hypothetical protein